MPGGGPTAPVCGRRGDTARVWVGSPIATICCLGTPLIAGRVGVEGLGAFTRALSRPCLIPTKIFKTPYHIEFYGTYIVY